MENNKQIRYRANVSRTQKGYSLDWTVEITLSHEAEFDALDNEILERSGLLGEALEARYPREFA